MPNVAACFCRAIVCWTTSFCSFEPNLSSCARASSSRLVSPEVSIVKRMVSPAISAILFLFHSSAPGHHHQFDVLPQLFLTHAGRPGRTVQSIRKEFPFLNAPLGQHAGDPGCSQIGAGAVVGIEAHG